MVFGDEVMAEYKPAMVEMEPEAVLVLGDTNSCLSVIGAKRLHIPIFHMEAGNCCKDECLHRFHDQPQTLLMPTIARAALKRCCARCISAICRKTRLLLI